MLHFVDMEKRKELLIFSRWLARLGEFQRLLDFCHLRRQGWMKIFKLRMNALAQVGNLERIHAEVANAPLIPTFGEW